MDPDDVTAPGTASADADAALAKLLQAQLAAHEGQPATSTSATAEPTFFGMTIAAIFLGFVISVVGLGLANYGRTTGNFVFAAFGVALMVVPFFVTSTIGLVVAGVVLLGVPMVMKKLQMI